MRVRSARNPEYGPPLDDRDPRFLAMASTQYDEKERKLEDGDSNGSKGAAASVLPTPATASTGSSSSGNGIHPALYIA